MLWLALLGGCSEYGITPEETDQPQPVDGEPIADAGADITTAPLETIRLDGSASYDPEDLQITGYQWTLVSAPVDSTAMLSDAQDDRPFFEVDVAGQYVFDLTVENARGVWDSTPDQVVVSAEVGDQVYIQLTWDDYVDLDLHLLRGTGPLYEVSETDGDACYCNSNPDWGVLGNPIDDPSLDNDETIGFGPETITIDAPAAGNYDIKVVYYGQDAATSCSDDPCPATLATLRVISEGEEIYSLTRTLDTLRSVWNVGLLQWPSKQITTYDTISFTEETSCY